MEILRILILLVMKLIRILLILIVPISYLKLLNYIPQKYFVPFIILTFILLFIFFNLNHNSKKNS